MTEKRFTVPLKYSLSHSKIQCDGEHLTNDELVRILNTNDGAFLENFNLKEEKKELKCQCNLLREQANEFHRIAIEDGNRLGQLEKENEQLKEENQELRHFKLSIKAFAECNDNINRRTLNDLIGEIDYD